LFRFHSARGTPPKEPWRWGEPWLSAIRAALERRYRLLPTLYTLMREASQTGLPPIRPLALHHPEEPEALRADDQFLLGRDVLIAPVMRPGQVRRLAYLPEGPWLHWFNLAEPGPVAEGRRAVIAEAPLDTTPIWLRAGGGVALSRPALHTTTARWPELEWHVHAARSFSAAVYEDEGDGYGPFRETRLAGERDGTQVRIRWHVQGELPPARTADRLQLYGLGARASRASGAGIIASTESATVLEVPADARELRIDLAR
jgi:alpha-glucosidase